MSISAENFYHGAALSLLVCNADFTVLSRDKDLGSGCYQVNQKIGLMIKYSRNKSHWQFTFSPSHQESIREMFSKFREQTFIALVCGKKGICLLSYGEYANVVDENFKEQTTITVVHPPRGQFHVRGSRQKLDHAIAENDFPAMLFKK